MRLTDDELHARKRRNLWLALGLVAFIVLVFLSTVTRLYQNHSAAMELKRNAPVAASGQVAQ